MRKTLIVKAGSLKEKSYGHTKVIDIINNKHKNISLALVKKVGDDIKLGYDTESDVIYYVLSGKGKCIIRNKAHIIKKGDAVFVPKGTPYKNLKGLTLLAFSSPRFDRSKRRYLE